MTAVAHGQSPHTHPGLEKEASHDPPGYFAAGVTTPPPAGLFFKLGLGIETQVLYLWQPGPSHAPL